MLKIPQSNQVAATPMGVPVGGHIATAKTVADYENFQSLEIGKYKLQEDFPDLFAKIGARPDRSAAGAEKWVKNTVSTADLKIFEIWTDGVSYIFGGEKGVIYSANSALGVLSEARPPTLSDDYRIEAIKKFKGKYYAWARDNVAATGFLYVADDPAGPWVSVDHGIFNYTDALYADADYLIASSAEYSTYQVASDTPTTDLDWANIALNVNSISSKGDGLYVAVGASGTVYTTHTPEILASWVLNTAVPNTTEWLYKVIYNPAVDKFYAFCQGSMWEASDPQGQWSRIPSGLAQGSAAVVYSVAPTYDGFFVTLSNIGLRSIHYTLFVDFAGKIDGFSLDVGANVIDPNNIYTVISDGEDDFIMAGQDGDIYTHARITYNTDLQFYIEQIQHENPKLKLQMRMK